MRHRRTTLKLSRTASHRDAMLRTMVTDLFRHEKVRTTQAKAKALRPYAEKLITLGKRETLHARRQAARVIRDKAVVRKLFDDLAPRYAERLGGYTRIIKLPQRAGDNADMALIELVEAELKARKKKPKKKGGPRTAAQDTAKEVAATEQVAEKVEETEVETDVDAGEPPESVDAASDEEADERDKSDE